MPDGSTGKAVRSPSMLTGNYRNREMEVNATLNIPATKQQKLHEVTVHANDHPQHAG